MGAGTGIKACADVGSEQRCEDQRDPSVALCKIDKTAQVVQRQEVRQIHSNSKVEPHSSRSTARASSVNEYQQYTTRVKSETTLRYCQSFRVRCFFLPPLSYMRSRTMSSTFNEALERASNPQMPPPNSPRKTPISPSRTSTLLQDKIKETVVTVPGTHLYPSNRSLLLSLAQLVHCIREIGAIC